MERPSPAGLGDTVSFCVATIRSAFADVPYPGDHAIGRRTAGYLASEYYEGRQVERFFAGRKWQHISIAVLRAEYEGDPSACLFFMTPAAFRYYLPSYMLITLDDFLAADMIPHSLMSLLRPRSRLPGAGDDPDDVFFSNIEDFSIGQRHATSAFLLALNRFHEASFSSQSSPFSLLHLFWQTYLDDAERKLIDDVARRDFPSGPEIRSKLAAHVDPEIVEELVAKTTYRH